MYFLGWDVIFITLLSMRYKILTKPAGKPIIPHSLWLDSCGVYVAKGSQ
jgi:hypothetical protein